jgi:hypothetical protein
MLLTMLMVMMLFFPGGRRADLLIAVNVALLSVNGYNVYRKLKYASLPLSLFVSAYRP